MAIVVGSIDAAVRVTEEQYETRERGVHVIALTNASYLDSKAQPVSGSKTNQRYHQEIDPHTSLHPEASL